MNYGISARGWFEQLVDDARNGPGPGRAALRAAYYSYLGLWHTVTSRYSVGTNVYERDWDALVVLDACRVDAIRAVSDEYDFLGPVDSIWSVGSTSHEWVAKTFTTAWREQIAGTGYVTANGYLYRTAAHDEYPPSGGVSPFGWPRWSVVDLEDFQFIDYVWQDGGVGDLSTVPPHVVTDRAIVNAREQTPERLVVHYMQPHGPHIADAVDGRELRSRPQDHVTAYRDAIKRPVGDEDMWTLYLDNLRFVLDEVQLLLENLDADRVVISADHGEFVGEFGLAGHPDGCPLPAIKRVPWVVTSGTDTGSHTPTIERSESQVAVEDHLRNLGYVV